jgi:sRNA-binding carbon storage regulator CsrA
MLTLTRKVGEEITRTDSEGKVILTVTLKSTSGNQAQLSFVNDEAETRIYRSEIAEIMPLKRKVIGIAAIGTGEKNGGDVFRAKPDIDGLYKLFKKGDNTKGNRIKVSSLDEAYAKLRSGFNIYLTSDKDGSTAQRMLPSCRIQFI